jgi:hypothetical protein
VDRIAIAAVRRSYGGLAVSGQQVVAAHVPLLAVVGSEDKTIRDVQELKKLRPDLQVVVIQAATHNAPPRCCLFPPAKSSRCPSLRRHGCGDMSQQ